MKGVYEYVSHLAADVRPMATACGEPWQGWQAPEDLPSGTLVLPPHEQPRPHQDPIRFCRACQQRALEPEPSKHIVSIQPGLVVKPDDHLLITAPEGMTVKQLENMAKELREKLPKGVGLIVLPPVEMALVRHTDAERCVRCSLAWAIPVEDGRIEWATSLATPDCDHVTLDGRK